MEVKNAYPDHIGVRTLDNNVDHTRWPCISHPASMTCEQALRTAARRGLQSLVPQPPNVRPFPAPQKEI